MRGGVAVVGWGLGLGLVGLLLACKLGKGKPEVGKACDQEGTRACLSPEQAAVCQSGQWRSFPCKGRDGCNATTGTAVCDISGNQVGDDCAKADEGKATCADPKGMTRCKAGKIERGTCKGPKGCAPKGESIYCDQAISDLGASCFPEGGAACTPDEKTWLVCKNGEYVLRQPCRGTKGCTVNKETSAVSCDGSVGYVGDPCEPEGSAACTHDGRARLKCKNGKLSFEVSCAGAGCKVTSKGIECP